MGTFKALISENHIPEHLLKDMIKFLSGTRQERFKKHSREYRGVNRTFKDEEINKLLLTIESLKYRLLFSLLGHMGLRIGEAVVIKLEDINLEEQYIKIKTEKQKRYTIDIQPYPKSIEPLLFAYLKRYEKKISRNGGWLFPQRLDNGNHITDRSARKTFAVCRSESKLDYSYAVANDIRNPVQCKRGSRKLYNRTLHSFRHWYKLKLDKANVPYGMVKVLMRHKGGSVTDQYGQYSLEEKKDAIDQVFSGVKI